MLEIDTILSDKNSKRRSSAKKREPWMKGLLILLLITIGCVGNIVASSEKGESGYMVIVNSSAEKVEAQRMLDQYVKGGLPKYWDGNGESRKFPRLVSSSEIEGLEEGYWVVVAAIADDEEVAETLSNSIRTLEPKSYIREVAAEKANDIRLLILKPRVMEINGMEVSIKDTVHSFYTLQQRCYTDDECTGFYRQWGMSSPGKKDSGVVIPYIPRDDPGNMHSFFIKTHDYGTYCYSYESYIPKMERIKLHSDYNQFRRNEKINVKEDFLISCEKMVVEEDDDLM